MCSIFTLSTFYLYNFVNFSWPISPLSSKTPYFSQEYSIYPLVYGASTNNSTLKPSLKESKNVKSITSTMSNPSPISHKIKISSSSEQPEKFHQHKNNHNQQINLINLTTILTIMNTTTSSQNLISPKANNKMKTVSGLSNIKPNSICKQQVNKN